MYNKYTLVFAKRKKKITFSAFSNLLSAHLSSEIIPTAAAGDQTGKSCCLFQKLMADSAEVLCGFSVQKQK